jgi:hypothetical protein
MNLCLNTFVIQSPYGLLDTYSVTVPRALLLRYAHRGYRKDEDSYKECWSHVEFSMSLPRIRLQLAIYFCLHRGSLPENTARRQVCLSKDVFRRRLESVEREKLNPPAGLRASHEWMGDVSTIPEAGRQNPGSDKTPSSSAPQDSTQPDELEEVMSLETALVRALQRLGAIW